MGKQAKQGTLIMASNSLGLPIDIPSRSIDALRESALLIFEEDRPARQALKAASIHREYLKFTEHMEIDTIDALKKTLAAGKSVCYMSDQGVPTLADPGKELLKIAYQMDAEVRVIPGPSSITAALAACPFLGPSFYYHGFLPREEDKRMSAILNMSNKHEAIVFLETPYRRNALLNSLSKGLGESRKALLAVDISGPEETFAYDSLKNLQKMELGKLNFVLIVEGQPVKQSLDQQSIKQGRKRRR